MEQSVKAILSTIDEAISKFQGAIPGIQKLVFEELQPLLKELQVKNGKLLNNVENLKLIGSLKNKLEKIIINAEYKQSVNGFIDSFTNVSNLNNEYFAQFNNKFKPKKTLAIIKDLTVEATINDLVGQGLSSNIIAPIQKILQQNITTGGSYAEFQEVLRNHILTNDTGEGTLQRYTKQITTDAINQYNAQYGEIVAQDLQFNWGRYIGSNITTTRQFCTLLVEKEWVHKSELPAIIKGEIDGEQCKLSKTTGLPLGMIPDTNADNFKVRRGGYNCGHQFFWVPDSSVPKELLSKFATKAPTKAKEDQPIVEAIKEKNKNSLDYLALRGVEFPEEVLKLLPKDITITNNTEPGSYFNPMDNEIVIGGGERAQNEYYKKMIVLHEGGHAIHINKKIITEDYVSPEFNTFYEKLKDTLGRDGAVINAKLWELGFSNVKKKTNTEKIGMLHDILGSITKGAYGAGHSLDYYLDGNKPLMEIFAHSTTLARLENEFADINPTLKELVNLMKEYGSNVLEGK